MNLIAFELLGIAHHGTDVLGHGQGELDPALGGAGHDGLHGAGDDGRDGRVLAGDTEASRLDLGLGQKILDQGEQASGVALDDLDHLPVIRIQIGTVIVRSSR